MGNDGPEAGCTDDFPRHAVSERCLRAIVEILGHPVFVKDRAFRFVLVNEALCRLVGRTAEEMLGRTDYDFFPVEQADFFRAIDERVFSAGHEALIDEEALTDRDGRVHVLRTVKRPLRDPETGEVVLLVGVITDVTRIKEAEAALRRANEELEARVRERTEELVKAQASLVRKERLAVLGQLTAGLAHQIRNPLAAIATANAILRRKLADVEDPEIDMALSAIFEEVWAANRIITDLVNYARPRPPVRIAMRVEALLEDALAEAKTPETVTIVRDVEEGLSVLADPRQSRDALASVIRNGFEAMPDGGTLTFWARADGAEVVLSVEDSGPGLRREALADLFEPLVTSKPLGLGLGLATARVLLENQHGSIRAATQRGSGARFEIRLPRAP